MTVFRETIASYTKKRGCAKRTTKARVADGTIKSIMFGGKRLLETPEATEGRLAAEQGVEMPDQPKPGAINGPTGAEAESAGRSVTPREPAMA
jgi:hypothetical protein